MQTPLPSPAVGPARRDYRVRVGGLLVLAIAAGGYLLSLLPGRGVTVRPDGEVPPLVNPADAVRWPPAITDAATPSSVGEAPDDPEASARNVKAKEVLQAAEALLKGHRYDQAIGTLNAQLPLLKNVPESYLLLGRALEGKKDIKAARDFYVAAINRDPYLYDAYWGVATTSEMLGDLEMAIGAMRSYLHTEPDKDRSRLRVAQARSAIWEWESQLGRGPWGPSKGIPPGFTAEQVKRDGRGVGIKMPIPGTERPGGTLQAEIKHADKIKMFERW